MNIKSTVLVLVFLTIVFSMLTARSFRVTQVPNGQVFDCNTCHISGGGTPRNSFGSDIESNYLTSPGASGDVEWGPELAALDSDGDGFTNGEELLDPNGEWSAGDPNPGDPSNVTAPGDPNDFPTSVKDEDALAFDYSLSNNYPNPFNPSTTIEYTVPELTNVSIDVYNSNGEKVKTIVDQSFSPGKYKVGWNGTDQYGSSVASGIYFYRIVAGDFTETKNMILLK